MRKLAFLVAAFGVAYAFATGCGGSDDSSGTSNGNNNGGDGSIGDGSGPSAATAFDACGGKIFDANGNIDSAEYAKQATLWDRATIDCRLGPRFSAFHPGDADNARATATGFDQKSDPKDQLCSTYEFGTPGKCTGACFGSTCGQVAYAPDDATDPGMDRVQTYGFDNNTSCIQPARGNYLGGPHPDPGITAWLANDSGLHLPRAVGRTRFVESNDAIVAFVDGFIGGTGTQTSGDTKPFTKLPANKIPTSVALTTFNEFALVTVWDTQAIAGQIAVFALQSVGPPAFATKYWAVPGEGGFGGIQLLGFIDLPDMKAPTAIAAAGDNGSFAGQNALQSFPQFAKPADDLVTEIVNNTGNNPSAWIGAPGQDSQYVFANAGTAIVASQWENEITFVDLGPLFRFVRSKYVTPIADAVAAKKANDAATVTTAENAFNQAAISTGAWPYDFTTNPEMKPIVIGSIASPSPRVVAVANRPATGDAKAGMRNKLKAWVGGYDGTFTAYDATSSGGLPARDAGIDSPNIASFAPLGHVQADPNPNALRLVGAYNLGDSFITVSRANRSVQWITAGETDITVTESLRDSQMSDPVDVDPNARFPYDEPGFAGMVTVADFDGKQIASFVDDDSACDGGPDTTCRVHRFAGSLAFPGTIYRLDTTNVN
ncbi:MAG: hypothetical protein ABI183_07945 [Polyangiaceae bacterium]